MTRTQTIRIFSIMTIALGIATTMVAIFAPTSSGSFESAAAVLAFASGAAIAIERVIEALWTFMGGVVGTYWPLNVINKQVETLVADLGTALRPFHASLSEELAAAAAAKAEISGELTEAKAEVDRLSARFDDLMRLAPDNQRIQLLTAAASQNVSYLRQKYGADFPDLQQASGTADAAINGLQDFLATFKDNPGRRLISIYLGALLGLGVAGIYGIDIFRAALGDEFQSTKLSIILTGISIGLGSGPTHEIIRAVQEYKKGRKGENVAKPDFPSSP